MRIKDMRRSVAAIAALAMAGACTAQGIEVHGGQRQPVRIDGSSTPDGTPKQDDGDGVDGGDRAAGGNDGDGKGAPERAPTTAPPTRPSRRRNTPTWSSAPESERPGVPMWPCPQSLCN